MKRLRLSLILLLIGLAIFFNIERLDFGEENLIDISTFVYVLGIIAIITTIVVPVFQRFSLATLMAFWSGIYLLSKFIVFMLFKNIPLLVGGIYTYLFVTELALLLISVWLAYRVSFSLLEFEDAVERITFSGTTKRIRQLNEADEEIRVEMFRGRHYHRPLSLIVVQPDPESIQTAIHHLVYEIQEQMITSYIINTMAQTLQGYLRRSDIILEQREQGRFIILCPETPSNHLDVLVEYVQAAATDRLGIVIACGVATFPDEAITFEELLNQAEARLNSTQQPEQLEEP